MTGDRATDRQHDGRQRHDHSVSDLARRDVAHQALRQQKSVERASDDSDYFADALIERSIRRVCQASHENVSVQLCDQDDRDDRRDLGQ